ncbi:hypothetical protein ACN47E_002906 [Coniothyrium glycines]
MSTRPILPESAYEALGLSPETIHVLMNPKPIYEPPEIAAPNLLNSDEENARPMLPDETSITLYAELLLNIRTVTLFASLRTNFSRETHAKLSANGSCITVSHEGSHATIRLPVNVKGGGDADLSLPSIPPNKEITLRLQIEELENSDLLGALNSEERQQNIVPWNGSYLEQLGDVEVICKNCREPMVLQGKIKEWRDLPNENWAEMMDFWHCHKPDEHHLHDNTHEEAIGQKGYAAGSRLQASQGIGFVDLSSILLKEQDCDGVRLPSKQSSETKALVCQYCAEPVGTRDEAADGWRLQKWSIGMRSSSSPNLPVSYSPAKWISARLLYLIENSGIRKFHIHPAQNNSASALSALPGPKEPVPSLLVWVFTPDLLFSSSIPSPNRLDPTRSVKVFYQKQTWQPLQPGEPENASIEDLEFPQDLYTELQEALIASQRLLPPTAKKFQGWDVALLDRFDLADVGRTYTTNNDTHGLESEDVD